jgi:hypothetical protein
LATLPSVEEVTMRAVAGFSERELARVRGRLVEFTGEIFESLRRKDQRRWGEVSRHRSRLSASVLTIASNAWLAGRVEIRMTVMS